MFVRPYNSIDTNFLYNHPVQMTISSFSIGYTNGCFVSIILFSVPRTHYPCEAVTVLGLPCIGLDLNSADGNATDEFVVNNLD